MGKKVVALAMADLHFHDWKQFNKNGERTKVTIDFLTYLFERSHKEDIPILFSGDLFHTPNGLSSNTILKFMDFISHVLKVYPNTIVLGITGNHDGNFLWKAMCKAFPSLFLDLDYNYSTMKNKCRVYGIPYIKRNTGLVDKIKEISKEPGDKILLLHTELYGASDPSGYEPEPQNLPRNLNALFKDFKLVLAGHVHKYTPISKNIVMVGAPNQQRKSDAGCEMGYLEIYGDFTYKFIPYKALGFKFYKEGDEHPDTEDFWIPIPKPRKLEKHSNITFKPNMDKVRLAEKYAKATGVKNKRKVQTLIEVLKETEE